MFDHAQLPVQCSKCGVETKKTIAWLKANDHLVCACGTRIALDMSHLSRILQETEKITDDFKREMQAPVTVKIDF